MPIGHNSATARKILGGDENIPPDAGLRLSRSPHPYHRTGLSVSDSSPKPWSRAAGQERFPVARSATQPIWKNEEGFSDSAISRAWKASSSSDSGTEADDESGGILRGLPAPPIRPWKGLKDPEDDITLSPLVTPTNLDDDQRRGSLGYQIKNRESVQGLGLIDEESRKLHDKYTRRKRAELLRRLSETLLLGGVGYLVYEHELKPSSPTWKQGSLTASS